MSLYSQISEIENKIVSTLEKNSLRILNKSIINMSDIDDSDVVFEIMHLQICLELLLKYYVSSVYGFKSILTKKMEKLSSQDTTQYYECLKNNEVRTKGFSELIRFLEDKKDFFGFIVKEGITPFYFYELNYLDGKFEDFQKIRNGFVHLGTDLSDKNIEWIKSDFFTMIILFISMVYRELEKHNNLSSIMNYRLKANDTDLFSTPIDILKRVINKNALTALITNEHFENIIYDIAEDLAFPNEVWYCTNCYKKAFVLNVDCSDGISKCLFCGELFESGYCDCKICGTENSVVFDKYNIEYNNNVISGYCYACENRMDVFKCPECDKAYNIYGRSQDEVEGECCKENIVIKK